MPLGWLGRCLCLLTGAAEVLGLVENLRAEYEDVVVYLCQQLPDIFDAALFTWENYIWAYTVCELCCIDTATVG